MDIDRRCYAIRADVEGNTVAGLAIPYEEESQPLPFIETIQRGAFAADLGRRNVSLLVEHDGGRVLADTRSNTLQLEETERGVTFSARLPDTRDGQDMRVLLRDGIYQNMSFGFVADKDEWRDNRRTIVSARLYEVSLVHTPAYEATAAAVRAFRSSSGLVARYLRLRIGDLK
jgi:HK97 family phage prohead protease